MDRVPMNRGFTLVEVMITMGILGAAMGVAVMALNTATVETALGTADVVVQTQTNRFAEELTTELRSASRSSISYETNGVSTTGYGDCIKFQVPVDLDGDGSVFDATTGSPEYGATLGYRHRAGDIVYRFVANQVDGDDEVLNETALGVDINNDSDQADVFTRGRFTRMTLDAVGAAQTRNISGRWFISGDLDNNDMGPDPIFERQTDGTITVNLWAVQLVRSGQSRIPARAHVTTSVLPQNQ